MQSVRAAQMLPGSATPLPVYWTTTSSVRAATSLWFRKSANGSKAYYAVDGLGSVVAIVDSTGAVIESNTYDAWGKSPLAGTFGYTGREIGSLALLYYRARYYDPTAGRFFSENPLRSEAGINRYAYILNSPSNDRGPFGLQAQVAAQVCCDGEGVFYYLSGKEAALRQLSWNVSRSMRKTT